MDRREDDKSAARTADEPASGDRPIRRGLVFTTVGLALLMMSVDATIVATALHALQHGLKTSINWAGWTLTAYSFGFVLTLPISGKLSEWYGRRQVFLGSVVTFTVASLCCGLANDIFLLIALRAVQAAGGAGFTPSATGIVVDHFGDARDRAVSLFGSIFPVGAMIGPIFGGLFVSYLSWRYVFFVNVPIGLLIILLSLRYVPRDPPHAKCEHVGMDAGGMVLLGCGLLAAMFAASYMGKAGAHAWSPTFIAPLGIAVVALWWFFHHINHSTEPFIAPRLVHGRDFGPVNLYNALYGGVTLGTVALIPLYATNRYGTSALASGTILIGEGATSIALTIASALLLRRTGYRSPMYVGSVIIVIGMLLLSLRPIAGISAYVWLIGAAAILGVGYGATSPASRNAGLQLAPEHSSTLAALRTMCMQIGSILTVSIATAAIDRSSEPGTTHAWIYVGTAALLAVALPLISRVPEHRGAW